MRPLSESEQYAVVKSSPRLYHQTLIEMQFLDFFKWKARTVKNGKDTYMAYMVRTQRWSFVASIRLTPLPVTGSQ